MKRRLRVNIAALRRALGDSQAGNRFIANVPGRGYVFVAPARRNEPSRSGEPPIKDARGNTIPTSLSRLVGRDDAIATILGRIGQYRFVTVVGRGGVGKTAVAAAAIEENGRALVCC